MDVVIKINFLGAGGDKCLIVNSAKLFTKLKVIQYL